LKTIFVKCCCLLLVSLLFCPSLFAQGEDAQGKIVAKKELEGNVNLSSAKIIAKIKTRIGQPFSQVIVSDDLKRLYSLGYFIDIKIDLEDYEEDELIVTFRVQEKPILSGITLSGNKMIRLDKLEKLIKSQPGDFFNIQQLKQDMNEIQKAYEARGFSLASIEHEMVIDPEINEAAVVIVIQEKKKIRIKKIDIVGNEAYSKKKIRKLIRTKRDTLFTSGLYRKEVLDLDLQRIEAFYRQEGYLDSTVEFTESLGPKGVKMNITITIEEGQQYLIGKIKVKGAEIFPEQEVRDSIAMRSGDIFNADKLKYDISSVQAFYFEKGYISSEVKVDTILNKSTGRMDVSFTVIENELAFVNKIRIRGNTKTKDIVIRRELRVYPGEKFDGAKLKRSKERLYNLGFFQEVSYDTEAIKDKDKKDLVVNVKEAKTGEFAFGVGFSSVERIVGFVEVAQKNFDINNWDTFTGAGQDLRVKAEFGVSRKDYELSFTEPWILGYPLSFGVDGYSRSSDRSGSTGYSYNEQRRGGDIRLGKEFTEFVRGDLMYKMEDVEINNVPSGASQDLRDEVGSNLISSLFFALTRDTRDNVFNPSRGLITSVSVELAGGPLGQDKDYYKLITTFDYYRSFLKDLLFEFKLVCAGADDFDDTEKVPIYERFYAGGTNSIRGFKERSVGPKDVSGEPIGGESSIYGTCELVYPLLDMIKVATFFDFGNVWEKLGDFASSDLRYSTGLGFRVKTPIGPVKVDYGYPLKVDPGEDKEGRFHFSMSRGF